MNAELAANARAKIHDARKPLNRISMQAEIVKMAINGDLPPEKANEALDKIIASTKDCSQCLADISQLFEQPSP